MNASVAYRDADARDAEALSQLFCKSFVETFGHLYQPQDLAAFLSEQAPVHWTAQLNDPAFAVRIAEVDGQLVGLAKLGPLKLPVDDPRDPLELRQLYVDARFHGSGVAAELTNWLMDEARKRGARELYLSVYTDNLRAQRFYARFGFELVGPTVFMVGNQADEDIIMRRSLI